MFASLVALSFLSLILARPIPSFFDDDISDAIDDSLDILTGSDSSTDDTTPFSAADIASTLLRPAQFSRISYCSTPVVTNWACGGPCDAVPNVKVLQAGGDDGLVPMYFIAHDPDTQTIVVAHQGTDSTNILSIGNDVQIPLVPLNETRFPSTANSDIQVHSGFQKTFERTADGVLSGVLAALDSTGVKKVAVTGHSLGAAIAVLDSLLLKQSLPPTIEISTVVFGLPRVGTKEWADFVDKTIGSTLKYVTNQDDPVPRVPPSFLDYQQISNEVHLVAADQAVACVGQEDESCSAGISPLQISVANHEGPYFNGISFGASACPL